jgi:hypothetical protein
LLQSTLELLRDRLDASFQAADPRSEEWVALTSPVDIDGRVFEGAKNKLLMLLVGLQSDKTATSASGPIPVQGDRYALVAPPLYLNAFILLIANFSEGNYPTGLRVLSRAIAFFQENHVFTPDRLPGLAPEIEKVALDFVSLDLSQMNYLMAMLGLKYLPSAVYKLRMLPFHGNSATTVVPAVRRSKPANSGAVVE